MAPAMFPCIFIPPLIVEPLLLETRRHSKVETGSGLYSIFTSTKYAGADCQSHTFIPVLHVHEQLFSVLPWAQRQCETEWRGHVLVDHLAHQSAIFGNTGYGNGMQWPVSEVGIYSWYFFI